MNFTKKKTIFPTYIIPIKLSIVTKYLTVRFFMNSREILFIKMYFRKKKVVSNGMYLKRKLKIVNNVGMVIVTLQYIIYLTIQKTLIIYYMYIGLLINQATTEIKNTRTSLSILTMYFNKKNKRK